jgi:hypothetical protein
MRGKHIVFRSNDGTSHVFWMLGGRHPFMSPSQVIGGAHHPPCFRALKSSGLRIYETHAGDASDEKKLQTQAAQKDQRQPTTQGFEQEAGMAHGSAGL